MNEPEPDEGEQEHQDQVDNQPQQVGDQPQ